MAVATRRARAGREFPITQRNLLPQRLPASTVASDRRPGEFLHKFQIPEFHNEATLVGVEKLVDFRLPDWLPKGDAGEHFKGPCCQLKICARATLFAHIGGQRLIFDPASQQRNHPVENPKLKADKAELAVEGNERGN